ncbi:hypothetical protein DZB54_19515 [Herbaspirillum sp. 3R-3a1]|nr:hypothetical protein DZB54_19515 [Herbaspirillum sp. 3R-3a1]
MGITQINLTALIGTQDRWAGTSLIQRTSKLLRRAVKITALFLGLFFLLYLYLRINTDPWQCPRIERTFLDQQYDVEECAGGYNNENPHYPVKIRIYSKSGELLGQRDFTVWTAPNSEKIEYLADKIIYNNALRNDEEGVPAIETKVLQFPLTKRDWFEANLDRILFSP